MCLRLIAETDALAIAILFVENHGIENFSIFSSIGRGLNSMSALWFAVVQKLQAFMLAVKKNVTEMEHLVEQAESDLGSVSTVKNVLNSVTLPSLFTPVTLT